MCQVNVFLNRKGLCPIVFYCNGNLSIPKIELKMFTLKWIYLGPGHHPVIKM